MVTNNCHHFFIRILPENTTMNLEGKLDIQKKHIFTICLSILYYFRGRDIYIYLCLINPGSLYYCILNTIDNILHIIIRHIGASRQTHTHFK